MPSTLPLDSLAIARTAVQAVSPVLNEVFFAIAFIGSIFELQSHRKTPTDPKTFQA